MKVLNAKGHECCRLGRKISTTKTPSTTTITTTKPTLRVHIFCCFFLSLHFLKRFIAVGYIVVYFVFGKSLSA